MMERERRGITLSFAYFLPIETCAPLGRGLIRDDWANSRTAAAAVVFLIHLNSVGSILEMFGETLVIYAVVNELEIV